MDSNHATKQTYYFHDIATLKLLESSVLVSMSGAFRIYLASLLLGMKTNVVTCLAAFLIIYSVYTLDRALDSTEDNVNHVERAGSNKMLCLGVSILSFLAGSYILSQEGLLLFALIPFITGYLYSKGIKIGQHHLRLKGGLGVKNIVVGLTWGIFIVGLTKCGSVLPVLAVFLFYGVKVFINSVLDDFKDIEGDTLAGIKTLPVKLGEKKCNDMLTGLHIVTHVFLFISLVNGVIIQPIIIILSCIIGIFVMKKPFLKDYESLISVISLGFY